MSNRALFAGRAGLAFLLLSGAAMAETIYFSSEGGQSTNTVPSFGAFSGSIQYIDNQLIFSITNTTAPADGGYLTAFALMKPAAVTGIELASYSYQMDNLLGPDVSAVPFGTFDFAVSNTDGWLGGGSPNGGIPVGGTGTFVFNLSGDLSGLTTSSFTHLSSAPTSAELNGSWLAVRFRGLNFGEGSDKVTPGPINGGPPPNEVPEPTTMALLGGALTGLALYRRRKLQG